MTGAVIGRAVPTSAPATARRGRRLAVMDTSPPARVGLQLMCTGVVLSWCPGLGGEWECPSLPVVKAARALSRWGKGFGVLMCRLCHAPGCVGLWGHLPQHITTSTVWR